MLLLNLLRFLIEITNSDDPFGDYFDATYVYGPIFGRMSYVGVRYYIN